MGKLFKPEDKMLQEEFPCSERTPRHSRGQNSLLSELTKIITSTEASDNMLNVKLSVLNAFSPSDTGSGFLSIAC